jgi:hypothetical protein
LPGVLFKEKETESKNNEFQPPVFFTHPAQGYTLLICNKKTERVKKYI